MHTAAVTFDILVGVARWEPSSKVLSVQVAAGLKDQLTADRGQIDAAGNRRSEKLHPFHISAFPRFKPSTVIDVPFVSVQQMSHPQLRDHTGKP